MSPLSAGIVGSADEPVETGPTVLADFNGDTPFADFTGDTDHVVQTTPAYEGNGAANASRDNAGTLIINGSIDTVRDGRTYEAWVRPEAESNPGIVLNAQDTGSSNNSFYLFRHHASDATLQCYRFDSGSATSIGSVGATLTEGVYQRIAVTAGASEFSASAYDDDGTQYGPLTVSDTTYTGGYLGVRWYRNGPIDYLTQTVR